MVDAGIDHALGWRRTRPEAVGVLTAVASIVSGLAAGPAFIAAFNVARRGSRRGVLVVVGATLAVVFLFPVIPRSRASST